MNSAYLANTLKTERLKREMSQEKFAELLGMTRTNYCSVEVGRRGISYMEIKRILLLLAVSRNTIEEIVLDMFWNYNLTS